MTFRTCSKCHTSRPISDYYFNKGRNNHRRDCRFCCAARARDYSRRKLYGVEPDGFHALVEAAGNQCVICHSGVPGGPGSWHIDHDHATGEVRGTLCSTCNVGLGALRDAPGNLAAALVYLAAHGKALTTEQLIDFLGVYEPLAKETADCHTNCGHRDGRVAGEPDPHLDNPDR